MRPFTVLRPPLLLLLPAVVWAATVMTPTEAAVVGTGDVREGYERTDYRTRSAALPHMPGRRLDLAARVDPPPLGLPPLSERAPLRPAAVDLGRALFFDRRLSVNGTLSCGMCHVPEQGFTQNELRTPVGLEGRSVRRNAPALYNVAYRSRLLHDGRESALEEQIWSPLLAENEMGNPDRTSVLRRIAGLDGYSERFATVYQAGLTAATLGAALASYQRALLSADSPFDRWHFGAVADALDEHEQRGFAVFQQAGCTSCHTIGDDAALFTDNEFHNTGMGYRAQQATQRPARLQIAPGVFTELTVAVAVPRIVDGGRFEVTGRDADRGHFRTPTLRNVAVTGPYMHDGSLATLGAVVDYYAAGGSGDPDQDPRVRPLQLSTGDKAALEAFLETLTGSDVAALADDARSVGIGDSQPGG